MSRDAKNSILLWAGALAFFGLFWASLHFKIGPDIPDRWLWPMLGVLFALNVAKSVWEFVRKRRADAR